MPGVSGGFCRFYDAVFGGLQRATDDWFIGLAARAVFASVLFVYFLSSALTKLGPGLFGFLSPPVGAYAQILPAMMQAVNFDASKVAFFPYGLIVLLGTWAEFVLPFLIVLGLFTRVASLGMIVFIFILSWVDITGHNADATVIGAPFDADPSAMISDQRLMWCFLLVVLVLRGAGAISLDAVLARTYSRS